MSKKIAFVASNIGSLRSFLSISINKLSKKNSIYIYSNLGNEKYFPDFETKNIKLIDVPLQRNISFLSDLKCFLKLFFFMATDRPDITITLTPKGGFLGITTSYLMMIKTRIHYYTGQVWVTKRGVLKQLLKFIDKIR